jgi:hypothetical protein
VDAENRPAEMRRALGIVESAVKMLRT